jgi:hypothetical protein
VAAEEIEYGRLFLEIQIIGANGAEAHGTLFDPVAFKRHILPYSSSSPKLMCKMNDIVVTTMRLIRRLMSNNNMPV